MTTLNQRSMAIALSLALVALSPLGIAAETDPAAPSAAVTRSPIDPYEGFNRSMFAVNEALDTVLKPLAQTYDDWTPLPVKVHFRAGLGNLADPINGVHDVLQGKPASALSTLGRVLINSTLGILGLFDVASELGLPKRNEDFGQTLAVWGVGEGPYLYLPVFGPKTTRDALTTPVDLVTGLTGTVIKPTSASLTVRGVGLVDTRARLLDLEPVLANAPDKYQFIRDAYLQQRRALVRDGAPLAVSDSDDYYDPATDGVQVAPATPSTANPNH